MYIGAIITWRNLKVESFSCLNITIDKGGLDLRETESIQIYSETYIKVKAIRERKQRKSSTSRAGKEIRLPTNAILHILDTFDYVIQFVLLSFCDISADMKYVPLKLIILMRFLGSCLVGFLYNFIAVLWPSLRL